MKPFFRYVLKQSVLVNLLFVLSMAVGFFALFDLPVERYPNVHMGKVVITTLFPGASPEEVEALVTHEIEEALDDLESVEFIQSTSYRERSSITVKFIDDTDYDKLLVLLFQWHYDDPGIQPELDTFDYAYRLAARIQKVFELKPNDQG